MKSGRGTVSFEEGGVYPGGGNVLTGGKKDFFLPGYSVKENEHKSRKPGFRQLKKKKR